MKGALYPRRLAMVALVVIGSVVSDAQGQSSSGTTPAFEVASVKPNKAGLMSRQAGPIPEVNRLTATNLTLRTLIQAAYQLADASHGGPSWMGSGSGPDGDRFDIAAKASAPFSPRDQWRTMLQGLLAERLKLVTHAETREESVFALMLARRDGKFGPNLHLATTDCAALRAAEPKNPAACGDFSRAGITGRITVRGMPLDTLVGLTIASTLILRAQEGLHPSPFEDFVRADGYAVAPSSDLMDGDEVRR